MENTLRVRRAERDVSQMDVAKATRIQFNRFWRIEKGYAEPRPRERAALARYFKVSETVLFPDLADDAGAVA